MVKINIKVKDKIRFVLFFILLPPFRISVTIRRNNITSNSKFLKDLIKNLLHIYNSEIEVMHYVAKTFCSLNTLKNASS
ncbi:hypothetical protein DIC82_15285 [Clostridium beijerinckii]|nr:hypothetical protein DIC82_15285 [Clostridium beijerinckii]